MRRRFAPGFWALAAAGLALCLALLRSTVGAQSAWSVAALQDARRTGSFENGHLNESSGIIPSRTQPGVLWSISDSDSPARVFATDTSGRDLGSFPVRGARNVDWEAISMGRCGDGVRDCLYIADTGDNSERRRVVSLYRLPEPSVTATDRSPAPRAERLELRYPNGPRDVEAAFVDPEGNVHLISKGRREGFDHYRIPASAWGRSPIVAEALGRVPLDAGGGVARLVTDAAMSPGGLVAVRTYHEIYLFRLTDQGTLRSTGIACRLEALELQGEGIAWLDETTLVTSSEGVFGLPGAVSLGRCPTA